MSVQLTIDGADLPTVMEVFRSYGIDFAVTPGPTPEVATQTIPVPVLDAELVGKLERAAASLAATLNHETVLRLSGAANQLSQATERLGGRMY